MFSQSLPDSLPTAATERNVASLREIAIRAREACEWYVRHEQPNFRHSFTPETLDGMCGMASVLLRDLLRDAGAEATITQGFVHGRRHCWVECEGTVFDITFSQFDSSAAVWIDHAEASPHRRRRSYDGIRSFCFWPRHLLPTRKSVSCLHGKARDLLMSLATSTSPAAGPLAEPASQAA
jgi:hypothetical protein